MKSKILFTFTFAFTFAFTLNAQLYLDESAPLDARVEDALQRMTTKEKVDMVHAQSVWSVKGVARLGIPELYVSDGPHGVRAEAKTIVGHPDDELNNDSCTAFPSDMMLSSTWNKQLAYAYGKALGEEFRYRDKDVALGPAVNIYRSPLCARNMEYMGEDPYLTSQITVPYIQGEQLSGVASCVKVLALYNQETNRHTVDIRVSDRALYEIYLPVFKAAVQEGNSLSIMAAYNKYNGQHCCHNERLLKTILRDEWGYQGVALSDWNGVHDTKEAIFNGLDLEMGTHGGYYLGTPYLKMLNSGEVSDKELNEKVRRVLRLNFLTAMNTKKPWGSINTKEHQQVAYDVASEGVILLKNTNKLLPIQLDQTKKILVVGENALRQQSVGGGSSTLKALYEITPLEAIQQWPCEVDFARGYVGDTTRSYNGYSSRVDLSESRSSDQLMMEAITKAKEADVVIFIGGLCKIKGIEREGWERNSFAMPYGQNELIAALIKANPNLVVVTIGGNAMELPFAGDVSTLVHMSYAGSEAGNALADVLSGKINPSGHLSFTWAKRLEDYPAHALNAFDTAQNIVEEYKEDIFLGYRYTDLKKSPKPLFAFGHGLSYTTFSIHDATIEPQGDQWIVTAKVTNTGKVAGKAVVQLYVGDDKASVKRPVKELKGFDKVMLQPGETSTVSFPLTVQDLSFWDEAAHNWKAEKGQFHIYLGQASDNIQQTIVLKY